MTTVDLSIHLARKDNLDLLKSRFPGLKVYVAEKMSDEEQTTYVLESSALKTAKPFSMPSDARLNADAPILAGDFQEFYVRHREANRHG